VRRSLRRLDRLCVALRPVAAVLHLVGVRTEVQQRNLAGSLAMSRALRAGQWRYAIITATLAPARAATVQPEGDDVL